MSVVLTVVSQRLSCHLPFAITSNRSLHSNLLSSWSPPSRRINSFPRSYRAPQSVRHLEPSSSKDTPEAMVSSARSVDLTVEEELLESFSSIANIEKAWTRPSPIGKGGLDLVLATSQRNIVGNSVRKFFSSAYIPEPQGDLSTFHWSPYPFELTGASLVSPSPSGNILLVIRNADKAKDASSPTKFEFWGPGRLLKEVFVPPSLHGPVYNDGWFEGVSWNSDESSIAYVAEEAAKPKRVFGQKGSKGSGSEPVSDAGSWKGVGEWVEDWGERYTDKGRPLLFILDIEKSSAAAVEGVPADLSAGQVVWAPSEEKNSSLVFVGWPSQSTNFGTKKRLGMVYCFNRPCALYLIKNPLSKSATILKLTAAISSAYSPRFSRDGTILVFLSARTAVDSGAHAATNSLHSISWTMADSLAYSLKALPIQEPSPSGEGIPSVDAAINTVLDVVTSTEEQGGFPGLYCNSLIREPWLLDNRTLIITTAWRSTLAIVSVNVETKRLTRLTPDGAISWSLYHINNNFVVAGASTPACPTKLMLGRINAGWLKTEGWLWSEISPPHVEYSPLVENALKSAEFEILSVPVASLALKVPEGAKNPFEAIFIRHPTLTPPPLLVVPHGGPHGVTSTNFILHYAFLVGLGYSVLHVNYRGSLGFGEGALQSLPKNVGRQDVADVLAAIESVVSAGLADADRVAVIGGSHGGFLAAHLIGQVPDRFKTAVLRNPVCNLATMSGTTDIPDWCYVEALGVEGLGEYSDATSASHLEAFYRASPISHVSKVKVPTLFFLGGADRRVPASNGLQFVHALRAQGLESKVVFFPEDNHALDKPQTEFEQWLTIAAWLKEHL